MSSIFSFNDVRQFIDTPSPLGSSQRLHGNILRNRGSHLHKRSTVKQGIRNATVI